MAQADFDRLVDSICKTKGITRTAQQSELLHLRVDGVACSLMPDSIREAVDAVGFICDFGAPPQQSRAEVLQRVMETNLFMFGPDTPRFACNPETGHVLYMGHLQLEGLNPESLLEMLFQVAQQAHQWNESHSLMQQPPQSRPSTSASLRTGTSSVDTPSAR